MIVIPTVDSADPTHETWQFDFLDDGILSGSSTSPLVTDLPVAITIDHFDFDGITNRQPLTGQATISLVDPTFTTVGQFIINVQRIGDQFIFDPFTLDALGFPDVSNEIGRAHV